jgi:nucleotide-binding universal stress UspA family protein
MARLNGPEVTGPHCTPVPIIAAMDTSAPYVGVAAASRPVSGHVGPAKDPRVSAAGTRPHDTPTGPIRRVLLATDLSPASGRAADEAVQLAIERGADLIVLSVVDPRHLRLPGGRFLRRIDEERSRVQSGVQLLVGRARAAGVRATFLVWEGDPAESIVAAAESEGADAIVLGSHGRGRLGRLVLGSTSARVAAEAHCRVLVIPG